MNLVLIDQMKDEYLVVVVQIKPMEEVGCNPKKDGPLPKHICKVLRRYKDVYANKLPQELQVRRKFDQKIEVILRSELLSKSLY